MAVHAFDHRGDLPIARPLLGLWEERAVLEVLRSRWLVQGERVKAFEDSVRRVTAAKYDQQFCPNSLEAERTSLALPLYAEMTMADVDRVVAALRRSLA